MTLSGNELPESTSGDKKPVVTDPKLNDILELLESDAGDIQLILKELKISEDTTLSAHVYDQLNVLTDCMKRIAQDIKTKGRPNSRLTDSTKSYCMDMLLKLGAKTFNMVSFGINFHYLGLPKPAN